MTLELRGAVKRAGVETHLYETSLALEPGRFNVLLGPTNAGKSTLIRILAGLDSPTSGEVWMDGRDVTGLGARRRNVALVHQFFVNYPHLSVYENIASPLRVAGLAKEEIGRRVEEAAGMLRLERLLERRPHELSGGQQQRCALARAIVKDAAAVFLDEPLANLDYKLREELREQLPELFAGRGAVVVYATSEPVEALLLGGATALVHEGRVKQYGPTAEIYRRPSNLDAAAVFSDPPMNFAPVAKRGGRFALGDAAAWTAEGPAAALADGPYTVGVRPHHVSPLPAPGAVKLTGRVQVSELSGSESVAHFDLGGRIWVSQAAGMHPYHVGEVHDFHLDPHACLYFGADGSLAGRGG